jgi:hypothetical protein
VVKWLVLPRNFLRALSPPGVTRSSPAWGDAEVAN